MTRRLLVDLALAAAFAVAVVLLSISAAGFQEGRARPLDAVAVVLVVLAALVSVGLRRVAPVWGLALVLVAVNAYLLAGYPYGPVQLCIMVSIYQVARLRPSRLSVPVCAAAAVLASGVVLLRLSGEDVQAPVLIALAWASWVVVPWTLGALARVVAASRERARRVLVDGAAVQERMRLAGEVHDIAGHGFAVVAMQAGIALQVLDDDPEQVRASLAAIRTTSTGSLNRLRSMLESVAPPGADDPGLDGITALVDEVRAAGLDVELDLGPVDLPVRQVGVVAHRVVQESLTNVLLHAGPTRADVHIDVDGPDLRVQVRDRGQGSPTQPPTDGLGLTGMRERVEALGGRLAAGPRDGGGFAVVAHLPLGGAP